MNERKIVKKIIINIKENLSEDEESKNLKKYKKEFDLVLEIMKKTGYKIVIINDEDETDYFITEKNLGNIVIEE